MNLNALNQLHWFCIIYPGSVVLTFQPIVFCNKEYSLISCFIVDIKIECQLNNSKLNKRVDIGDDLRSVKVFICDN